MSLRLQAFLDLPALSSCCTHRCRFKAYANLWVRAGVLLLTIAVSPEPTADPTPNTSRSPAEAIRPAGTGDFYDDPDADYSDDGSRALKLSPGEIDSNTLTPISPLEESGLLGNWGDSLEEAED